jgi:hypothetical protein
MNLKKKWISFNKFFKKYGFYIKGIPNEKVFATLNRDDGEIGNDDIDNLIQKF